MRKVIVIVAVLLTAVFVAGCSSVAPAAPVPSASELLASAKASAPGDTLVGQGTAKESSKEASEKKAKDRALFAIVKAEIAIVKELIDDQVASGRLSSSVADEFRQNITTALSRSSMSSVVKQDAGFGAGDEAYAVYYLSKGDTLKEINAAVNAAKQEVAAGNFNTSGFDAKYTAAIAKEWKN